MLTCKTLGTTFSSLAFLLSTTGCNHADAPSPAAQIVQTTRATRGDVSRTLHVAGMFQPFQEVEVHAKVSGYIRRINVDIGDRVHVGQVLATLEIPEMDAELKGSDAEVRHSKDEITRAENQVAVALSQRAAVHSAYMRLQQASTAQPGMIAQQELDDAQAKDQSTQAQVDVAKAALSAARQQSDVSAASRMRVGAMANYASITSPLSGVVTWRYADTGSLIQAGTTSNTQALPVVKIAQSEILRLRMPVPESDVRFIHDGGDVQVHIQATGQILAGKIVRFTHSLDTATRTMLTEVDVPNASLTLSPGMYADSEIQLQHKTDVITIPAQAIVEGSGQPYVFVVDASNHLQKREVTLGIQDLSRQEITSGLSPGDQVVTVGQSSLQSGEPVRPRLTSTTYTEGDAK